MKEYVFLSLDYYVKTSSLYHMYNHWKYSQTLWKSTVQGHAVRFFVILGLILAILAKMFLGNPKNKTSQKY